MARKKLVVIGIIGTTLDVGKGPKRWNHWRPTVSLCQREDLVVDRLELLHGRRATELAQTITKDIAQVSPETTVRTHVVEFTNPWALEEVYEGLYAFARSYPFHTDREDYLIHITTGTHVAQICMFLLAEARYIPARLVQTGPPTREKPEAPGTIAIIDLDLSKYDRIASRFAIEQKEGLSLLKSGIDTKNKSFNRLVERLEQVAIKSKDAILLSGPTGSGKSQLAKKLFALKKTRRQLEGDLVEVNCATIRGDGAMSTLFGHVKGAFTGASGERLGLLRKAQGGVLFLDEIGELGLEEQAMLLRAIEEKVFYPVGADRESKSEFQLVAGTNRDLAVEVREGRFREDLLARINVWSFRLPALRERVEDIEPNLDYELEAAARIINVHCTMSREARDEFLEFAKSKEALWPGNFRDFGAAIRRMATLSHGGRIGTVEVNEEIERLRESWRVESSSASASKGGQDLVNECLGLRRAAELDPFDAVQLEEVLRICIDSATLSEAGRTLFAVSRSHKTTANDADRLRKYLARFDLDWAQVRRQRKQM